MIVLFIYRAMRLRSSTYHRHLRHRSIRKRKKMIRHMGRENDVFAAYCVADFVSVLRAIRFLTSMGLSVFDPYVDGFPGKKLIYVPFINTMSGRLQNVYKLCKCFCFCCFLYKIFIDLFISTNFSGLY